MLRRLIIPAATLALTLAACGARTTPTVVLPTAEPPTSTAAVVPTDVPPAATNTALPATATTAPSATPEATATASPSPSPIAPPTETVPATPDPNEGVGDTVYQDPLDGSSTWFWTFDDDVANFGVVDGRVRGVMAQANSGWRFTISPTTLRVGDQQLKLSTHTVACADNDEYGVLFRMVESTATDSPSPYDGYLFKLRCGGAARLDLIQGTTTAALVDWMPSSAIHSGAAADNALTVWARGGEMRFYANDQYLFSAQDTTLTTGFYGLYLYDRSAGGATVTYEDLAVRAVVP
jgi:hypothetical protein